MKDEGLLTLERRNELLEKYYDEEKVKKYYVSEFKKAEDDIRDIFGITKDGEINGEKLIFNYEPYLNIVDNKKQAEILFRNVEISFKVILEEDYTEIRDIKDKKQVYRKFQEVSIPVSRNIYYQLYKSDFLKKEGKLYIIKKEAMKKIWIYDEEAGLRKIKTRIW